MADMTDRELNEHMDDYEQVSPSLFFALRETRYDHEKIRVRYNFLTPSWSCLVLFLELLGLVTSRDSSPYHFTCETSTHP